MTITISKEKIYEEVARATLYTGAKHPEGDPAMLSRVAVIDADRPLLSRFCDEALTSARLTLRQVLDSASSDDDTITLVFRLSPASDDTLTAGLADSLTDYLETAVIARWLAFSDKAGAAICADEARILLDECLRKALYKRRPSRPMFLGRV